MKRGPRRVTKGADPVAGTHSESAFAQLGERLLARRLQQQLDELREQYRRLVEAAQKREARDADKAPPSP